MPAETHGTERALRERGFDPVWRIPAFSARKPCRGLSKPGEGRSPTCSEDRLSPSVLPGATIGTPYNQTVTAGGGTAPYTYSVSGALPTGLTLNPTTGAISGTPTTLSIFDFTITATDANGCTGAATYVMTSVTRFTGAVVPALSGWGLALLVGLTALVSTYLLRRPV